MISSRRLKRYSSANWSSVRTKRPSSRRYRPIGSGAHYVAAKTGGAGRIDHAKHPLCTYRAVLAKARTPHGAVQDDRYGEPDDLAAHQEQRRRQVRAAAKDVGRDAQHVAEREPVSDGLERSGQQRERRDLAGEDAAGALVQRPEGVHPGRPERDEREHPAEQELQRRAEQKANAAERDMPGVRREARLERDRDDDGDRNDRHRGERSEERRVG